jgi:hypothetical protein
MKFLQLVLGLGGLLCNYSSPWCRVHKNQRDDMTKPLDFLPYSWYAENITESEGRCRKEFLSTLFCLNVKRNAASFYLLSKLS